MTHRYKILVTFGIQSRMMTITAKTPQAAIHWCNGMPGASGASLHETLADDPVIVPDPDDYCSYNRECGNLYG